MPTLLEQLGQTPNLGTLALIEQKALALIPSLVIGLCILLTFYLVAVVARFVLRRILRKLTAYTPLVNLACRIVYITLIGIGLVTALGTAGVDVTAMVASLGLFGFTLGLAFKDLLSNTLSGVMILFYRPFRVGDKISSKEFEGIVDEINLRYTILNGSQAQTLIPNSTVLNSIITVG